MNQGATANFKYLASGNVLKDGELRLEDYQTAAQAGMSVSQLLSQRYPDADVDMYGSVFQQGMHSLGIYTKARPDRGVRISNMQEIFSGQNPQMAGESLSGAGSGIVAPSQQGTTPATRIFFPEVVMQIMNEVLQEDYSLEGRVWANMIASKETIGSEMFTQPLINVEAPKAERSAPISQNALPKNMVSITTSQYAKSILTNSIGLQISDQALMRTPLDLVGIIFTQQSAGESLANMWSDIAAVIGGNLDTGDAAITPQDFTDFDSGAATGTCTQAGWIKFLYDPSRKISIDSIICDIDTFLKIQNRVGRPVMFDPNTTGTNTGNLGTFGLNVEPNLLNVSLGVPNVLVVPTSVVAADTIVGFDSRFALRQVTNASAEYAATEKMVLQRSNFWRVDWGRMAYRLFDSAFRVTTLDT